MGISMVKIIEKADPKKWRKEVSCSSCTSRLDVKFSDLKVYDAFTRRYSFLCPHCKESNIIFGPKL